MKTVRMRKLWRGFACFCWIFVSAGCQWISGLDDLRVSSKDEGESVTSGPGGAGGFGGGTAASGGGGILTGGGGDITGGDCSLLDLSNQAPVYCSETLGSAVTAIFQSNCSQGETLDLFWIPDDPQMSGSCGTLTYYNTFTAGTTLMQPTFIGHRWRIQEAGTGRVLKDDIVIDQEGQIISVP